MSWKDTAKQQMVKAGTGKRFKLQKGDNNLRVLPTKDHKGDEEPSVFHPFNVHPNVGPEKRWPTCGKDANGKGRCYTCDKKIPKLEASSSRSDRKRAEDSKPIEQLKIQVASYNPEAEKFSGPFPLDLKGGGADSISFRILKALQNPKKDCVDPRHGHNIGIEATGDNLSRRYSSPVIDDDETIVPKSILLAMKTFDELIPKYSEQAHIDAWSTRARDEEEDYDEPEEDEEEEEERPKKKGKAVVEDGDEVEEVDEEEDEPAPKKKRKVVEDEDEEDAEEEEPAPKKKKRLAPVEDEDEEEVEEEDEEEEPAPKKKAKVVAEDDDEIDPEYDNMDEEDESASKKKRKVVEEEDEEEEPAPKKKAKKPPVEEDDEEDEPEDDPDLPEEDDVPEDEEEEPAPKKVTKKSALKKKVRR